MLLGCVVRLRVSLTCTQTCQLHKVTSVRLLEHIEYSKMKDQFCLSKKPLGSVDSVCSYILGKDLLVNQRVLFLDALGLRQTSSRSSSGHIRELKKSNVLKTGGFTMKSDNMLMEQYKKLLVEVEVDEEALKRELFSEEKCDGDPSTRRERLFLLKRQLVGFWLMQELPDGDRRLPTEVYGRLATLLFSGNFTEVEDATIISWVEEHGPRKWSRLALKLERFYPKAGDAVRQRHGQLVGRQTQGRRTGAFSEDELVKLTTMVLDQNKNNLEELELTATDWNQIANELKRSKYSAEKLYNTLVFPTLKRYLAGTLENDVRDALVQKVKETGATHYIEINFQELAKSPEFKGHTPRSLGLLYDRLQNQTRASLGNDMISSREVTVDQVNEYWSTSKRNSKSSSLRKREDLIISTYLNILQTLANVSNANGGGTPKTIKDGE